MDRSSDSPTWQVLRNLFLMETDQLLAGAGSELMKQEYKVESLNTCIGEFQRQTYSQRLHLEGAHHGYVDLQERKSDHKKSWS